MNDHRSKWANGTALHHCIPAMHLDFFNCRISIKIIAEKSALVRAKQ
ncbi:hypothetical protein [Microvirga zambiensis]|nr:hypothetical protein [Microvirga zambiensis]